LIDSISVLERLISFPTVSRTPNICLIEYVRSMLEDGGIATQLIPSDGGECANLHARVGPADRPGVVLSGHSDVVPVADQPWTREPFELTREKDRFYGRGTADMKGFVACAVRAMLAAAKRDLDIPLHLALSYDEEIGCVGVRGMLDILESTICRPALCIVGEPTELNVATGHKGKTALRARCFGRAAHSALTPQGCSAIHLACDLIGILREQQRELERSGARDEDYDVPYTTIHAGLIAGGTALNIVPDRCSVEFEIRNLPGEDPGRILRVIENGAARLVDSVRDDFPDAGIRIDTLNSYPGLETDPEDPMVAFVQSLVGEHASRKIAFGTEGGLFRQRLGVPTVVCGPGSMDQGHKADEFVTEEQLRRCDAMMERLIERLIRAR
jgi:acetylornithine deacetylase